MTDQEHIAALYSRLTALRLNVGDALVFVQQGQTTRAAQRLKTAFAIDDKAAETMAAKLYPKGE